MTPIELGYADAEPMAPPGPPSARRSIRRLLAAAVAVLCLATLTASTRPRPHGLVPLWSAPGAADASLAVVGDAVLVLSDDGQTLSSYALADGAQRWSRALSDHVGFLDVNRDDHVLLLGIAEQSSAVADVTRYFVTRTIALAAATGVELWRGAGSGPGWAATGTALLEERTSDGAAITRLRLVRLVDGREIWRRETPDVHLWTTFGGESGRPDRIATVTGDGSVRVLRLADGIETASGATGWRADAATGDDHAELIAKGTALYLIRTGARRSVVTAYSDRTLSPLWTAEQPPDGMFYPCGSVLCFGGGTGGLAAYNWQTGAVRWRTQGQGYPMPVGNDLLLDTDGGDPSHQRVFDAGTGRTLADLGTANLPSGGTGDRLVTLGPSESRPPRTVVRRVDPRSGETFLLGTIDPVGEGGCQVADKLLLCLVQGARLSVTAVG